MEGAFDTFCQNRMISDETQILFREWFRGYLGRHFKFNDDVANHLMKNMPIEDITFYWSLFIRDWSKTLPEWEKGEGKQNIV